MFRDTHHTAQEGSEAELALRPALRGESDAKAGMLLLDLQPHDDGLVAGYTHRVFAVAEPSEAAAAIARRVEQPVASPEGVPPHRSDSSASTAPRTSGGAERTAPRGSQVPDGAECHGMALQPLSERFDAGGVVAATDGSGVLWRRAFVSSQSLFAGSDSDAVTITTLVLHEWSPARTVSREHLAGGRQLFAGRVVACPYALGHELACALCSAGAVAVACAKGGGVAVSGGEARAEALRALQASWQAIQGGCSVSDAVLQGKALELHEG